MLYRRESQVEMLQDIIYEQDEKDEDQDCEQGVTSPDQVELDPSRWASAPGENRLAGTPRGKLDDLSIELDDLKPGSIFASYENIEYATLEQKKTEGLLTSPSRDNKYKDIFRAKNYKENSRTRNNDSGLSRAARGSSPEK